MLTSSEITQLSDKDLNGEISQSQNSLFRQKMGVKTGHLKDSHIVTQLKKYVARLLTELTRRRAAGEKVEKSDDAIAKKMTDDRTKLAKAQEGKKKKKDTGNSKQEAVEKIEEKSAAEEDGKDVKVKKVEKRGLFGRKKNVKEEEKK